MVGILVIAALFWATGALPIGITAMLVGFLMYVFGVFTPDLVAKSYAKDAVIFIIGVLAMSVGIAKSGLDRRIGLLLLGTSRSRCFSSSSYRCWAYAPRSSRSTRWWPSSRRS
ncbi:MAG: SLC13 family permease [Myxococcota bacterium]